MIIQTLNFLIACFNTRLVKLMIKCILISIIILALPTLCYLTGLYYFNYIIDRRDVFYRNYVAGDRLTNLILVPGFGFFILFIGGSVILSVIFLLYLAAQGLWELYLKLRMYALTFQQELAKELKRPALIYVRHKKD